MNRSLMKAFHLLPLSFTLIQGNLNAEPFYEEELFEEDFIEEVAQPTSLQVAYAQEEDEEDEDEEEEENQDVAVAPEQPIGPQGKQLKAKQDLAQQIQEQRSQPTAPKAAIAQSELKRKQAMARLKQQRDRRAQARAADRQAPIAQSEAPSPRIRKVAPQVATAPAPRPRKAPPQIAADPTPTPPTPAPTTPPANPTPAPTTPPANPTTAPTTPTPTNPPASKPQTPTQTSPSSKPTSYHRRKVSQANSLQSQKRPAPRQKPQKQIAEKAPEGVNLSARPTLRNGGIWLSGDALLWQANQDNMEYTYKGVDASDHWDIESPSFDWDWGFRVGLGYNIPHDRWDLALVWTSIENHAHGHSHEKISLPVDTNAPSLYNVWTTSSGTLAAGSSAHGHWNNSLNQVDLDIGRNYFVGHYLSMRPYAGLRSAWIFQKYNIDFNGQDVGGNPITQHNHMTNRYWGIGFCGGIGTDWMFTRRFSLYGNAGMALMLGFFDVNQSGSQDDLSIFKISKSFRTGRPVFDLGLGLKWFSTFCKDKMAFTLKAGYEYHLYCNQNKFLQSNGSENLELFNPVNGDLYYQGGTLSARFDF